MVERVLVIPNRKLLSIQGNFVSGYSGSKAATFPLQLLGIDVDSLHTVQFSNHIRYRYCKGHVSKGRDHYDVYLGLKENNLLRLYDHIITGYVADVTYVDTLASVLKEIKDERKSLNLKQCFYTFDPVLGNLRNGYYVLEGEDIARAFIKKLLPLADVVTPNLFELKVLTGTEIDPSAPDAMRKIEKAIKSLHEKGPRVVALTSVELDPSKKEITCILSYVLEPELKQRRRGKKIEYETYIIRIPKIEGTFAGLGDLFTALLAAWFIKTNFSPKQSLEYAVNSVQGILDDTVKWAENVDFGPPRSLELRIIQNPNKILHPTVKITSERIYW